MRVSREKAIELIDEKISQFEAARRAYKAHGGVTYEVAYYGTLDLLTELFSEEETARFRERVDVALAPNGSWAVRR